MYVIFSSWESDSCFSSKSISASQLSSLGKQSKIVNF
jgi:hypothetical protein